MSTLIGILLDVSGSMEESFEKRKTNLDNNDDKQTAWARSIFEVVDQLIQCDVGDDNQVFAFPFGANKEPYVFDLFETMSEIKRAKEFKNSIEGHSKVQILQDTLDLLKKNGARFIYDWAKMHVLQRNVNHSDAVNLFTKLKLDSFFCYKFVENCLPDACKTRSLKGSAYTTCVETVEFFGLSKLSQGMYNIATEDEIIKTVEKGIELAYKSWIREIRTVNAAVPVKTAANLLRDVVGKDSKELTEDRTDELMDQITPYIYGRTPMMQALLKAESVFLLEQFRDHHKLLFVLSDGKPTDGDRPAIKLMVDNGVRIASCYITHQPLSNARQLKSQPDDDWSDGAKFMFNLSSKIPTQKIPRTLFIKQGWTVEVENNETHLFLQINNPALIKEACSLAKDVVCSQDSLSDVLASVKLDIYINGQIRDFGAPNQTESTCYANAAAATMHLAMKRITNRSGGYPEFDHLRKKFISRYGINGAHTINVLQEMCPKYRLQCQVVDVSGALKAVAAKRPVVATFRLTDSEWKTFSKFFQNCPTKVLQKANLDITQRSTMAKLGGHAVVLTSFDSTGLRFMNSWGADWGDGGFFRVGSAAVLGFKFIDVFWTLDDLTDEEKSQWAESGSDVAKKIVDSLQALKNATYDCPVCHENSPLSAFSGHLVKAVCSRCKGSFNAQENENGNILALNLYLTSLKSY